MCLTLNALSLYNLIYAVSGSKMLSLFTSMNSLKYGAYCLPLIQMAALIHILLFLFSQSICNVTCSFSLYNFFFLNYVSGIGGKMSAIPILYGPTDTSNICDTKFFTAPTLEPSSVRSDCITATVQIPKHTSVSEGKNIK